MGSMKILIVIVAVVLALLVIVLLPSRRFTWDKEDVAITGEGLFTTVRGIEGKSPDGRKQQRRAGTRKHFYNPSKRERDGRINSTI